jgi:hypothetical protein
MKGIIGFSKKDYTKNNVFPLYIVLYRLQMQLILFAAIDSNAKQHE